MKKFDAEKILFYKMAKVLVIPRSRWLRLNMTEKLFTGTLNYNQNKNKNRTKWQLCELRHFSNLY